MSKKNIYIGEIGEESYTDTPIEIFKIATVLAKQDDFDVFTNNPQFVEALEVLCGEDDISVYLLLDGKYEELDFFQAYNYLGDVYDIINALRFHVEILDDYNHGYEDEDFIEDSIIEYEEKWRIR